MRRMSTAGDPAATAPPPEGALCASCHTPLLGRYCHACGERLVGPHDFTLKAYFEHVLEEVTHLDGKVWRTLRRQGLAHAAPAAGKAGAADHGVPARATHALHAPVHGVRADERAVPADDARTHVRLAPGLPDQGRAG
jgi:hypothetical protein